MIVDAPITKAYPSNARVSVIANATVQRQLELRDLAAQLTQGETGQSFWTVLAADDRVRIACPLLPMV